MSIFNKNKFVLILGDEGCVLSLVENNKIKAKYFAESALVADRREFQSIFRKYNNVPIYLLIDTMEQSYSKQILPAVSSFSVSKLVQKRLERDFAASDIKGAVAAGRLDTGRKDWMYMFASTPVNSNIQDWLDYLLSLPNKFIGIYMLPVEVQNLAVKFNKQFFSPKEKDLNKSEWQFFVLHNKTGGFRQVILKNEKVVFTRLIKSSKENIPDIIAGNIEQELINTIDYLRRLSLDDSDEIDIIVILEESIKRSLSEVIIRNKKLILFTPYELANKLNFKNIISETDKFTDLIIASNFVNSRPILRMFNENTKKLNIFDNILSSLALFACIILPIFLIYYVYIFIDIIKNKESTNNEENNKAAIEKEWKLAVKSEKYDLDDANKITDAVKMKIEIEKIVRNPFDVLNKIAIAQKNNAYLYSVNWRFSEDKKKKKNNIYSVMNLNFYNTGSDIEQLFANFEDFTNNLYNNFANYELSHTKLPDQITFDQAKKVIPIQVKINSKDK